MVFLHFFPPHLLSFTEVFKLCSGIISPERSLKEWQAASSGRVALNLGRQCTDVVSKYLVSVLCVVFVQSSSPFTFCLIRKYIAIVSYEQRQNYKDDFNAEYDEYRALHARMETVARRFIKLDAQRKRLSPGSKEYQNVHEEVLQEYQKIKQSSPNYHEEKYRCEYLHNKLAHIKRLIGEFDQQQAESWH